jgi:hypothetical protein
LRTQVEDDTVAILADEALAEARADRLETPITQVEGRWYVVAPWRQAD